VIAASSSGQSFGALGTYLVGDDGRVGWAETRNMMEGMDGGRIDPDAVAAEMRDEAAASGVAKPVYHIAIAFDPDDHPTEAEVRAAADRTLRDLGLEDHQALVVRHTDQPHAHVHLMVNRVGPDGKAWSTWRDRYRLRASMEAQERELGVRWTGRNRELEQELPDGASPGAAGSKGFAVEVRATSLGDLRESESWADLNARLAASGLRVERRGRDAVVTDGTREAKLSSVSRTVSRKRLEDRLGPLRESAGRTEGGGPRHSGNAASDRDAARRADSPRSPRRGRPRTRGAARTSRQVRARRRALGRTPSAGHTGDRASLVAPRTKAVLASRLARGGLAALGASGQPDTDVERRLPRLAGTAARLAAGAATSRRAVGGPQGQTEAEPRPSLAERTLAQRASHRDVRPGGRVDRLAALVAERERVGRLGARRGHAANALARTRASASRTAQKATARTARASEAFSQALGRVYADPTAAGERFLGLAAREGPDAAAQKMAERPEAFGALRKAETKRALGLLRRETTDPARSGASEAARTGAGYIRANQARVEAAGASRTLSAGAGRHASDPVARALAVRLRRMERALAGPDGTPLGDRRLRDLDARISRAAGRIGRVPEGLRAAHGAPRSTVRGTRRATRALAARVGTVGVRVVAGVVRATGRGLGRE
jgi:hypothetical protein